jgi:hypothetical protein
MIDGMKDVLRELYGAGIIFFYYLKYPILVGWPLLRYILDYPDNIIMDFLWLYCLLLVLKDIFSLLREKKRQLMTI